MKEIKKFFIIFLILYIIINYSFFLIDFLRSKNSMKPIFCIETDVSENHQSYIGLFYKVYEIEVIKISGPEVTEPIVIYDYKVVPWFK